MRKLVIAAVAALAVGVAGAQTTNAGSGAGAGQQTTVGSSSVSAANGGSVNGVNASNGLTVGCLVNCASTDQGAKDAADAAVTVATINAGAAKDIAKLNTDAAKEIAGKAIRNTPSVNGPPLTSSNDTCMGSASGSVNAPGIGVSLGKTYTDANCVMLKNSRELWNMGMKAAALALMCKDADNREALELTGFECPQTTKARNGNMEVQRHAQASQEQYTDPIVRARLGLPPLQEAK